MPAGRPLQYQNPEEMQVLIDEYFTDCLYNQLKVLVPLEDLPALLEHEQLPADYRPKTRDIHPTITGMGLVLDLTRQSLINYEGNPEFLDTVKKAKARVEAYVEQRMFGNNVAGCIFNLKNNFGWKDKTEVDQNISGELGGTWNVEIKDAKPTDT